jgi:GNAT superfamily N-acetyltransferase
VGTVRIKGAQCRDIRSWLDLAAEVEPLFGAILDDPAFHVALLRNIERGTAYCVREGDGPPGAPLLGGLLFSPRRPDRPDDRIGWLAVAGRARRRGVGRRLVAHAIGLLTPPAVLTVVTFAEEVEAGRPARRFYERLGFDPAEPLAPGPEGGGRQRYRLDLPEATTEGAR